MFGLDSPLIYVLSFVVVLTAIVYVHELGHYWVARWCNVRVDAFSIGFGRKLFGWVNRHGTQWRISIIPLGGYVKFFGDEDVSSQGPAIESALTPEERAVSFHHKPLLQRTAIVLAGPAANFVFAIAVFSALFLAAGQPFTPPIVSEILPDSAAQAAGFQVGDRITRVDNRAIDRFEELRTYVVLRAETPVEVAVLRDGAEVVLTVTPRRVDVEDGVGGKQRVGQIGLRTGGVEFIGHTPVSAVVAATHETWEIVVSTMTYLGRVVSGRESGEQISGPLGIAKISGEVAKLSLAALISLMATLSVAIGLVNLFPIPMLDGGHLLFYAIEVIRGRPLGAQTREYGFRLGLAAVVSLFLFATWNDLNRLHVVSYLSDLFS
jgi:regulator of sigma E protease